MHTSYKTELKPNNKQITLLKKHCGTARFAYNWGLAQRIKQYEEGQKYQDSFEQHTELVKLKQNEFAWMYEVSKCAPHEALRDLDVAYSRFFTKKSKFPKFKKRKEGSGSFSLMGQVHIRNDSVKLPRIGTVRLKEKGYLPTDVKVKKITVSEKAGRWFVSFAVEQPDIAVETSGEIIGIDLGINKLATVSDGTVFENPKTLKKKSKQLAHLQRDVNRKQKGSNNRKKAVKKVVKLHFTIANIRKDNLHKITTTIAKTKPSVVVMEDLNVSGMAKNHCLAKSISDASFSEFKMMLQYKLDRIGSQLILADRFYPSSKLCSNCGSKKDVLGLDERVYHCEACGFALDRDLNASLNLVKYYHTGSLPEIKACGESVSFDKHLVCQTVSAKQEVDRKFRSNGLSEGL